MNHFSRASIFRRPDWPIRFEGSAFTPRERYTLFAIKRPRKSYERNNFEQLGCNENDAPLL